MAPRNPSELARLEGEYKHLKVLVKTYSYRDKNTRETVLRRLREVEDALGIKGESYNSSSF